MQLYRVRKKVFFVVGVLGEIQSSSGRVPLVEGDEVLLPNPLVGDEGALDGFPSRLEMMAWEFVSQAVQLWRKGC